MVENFQKYTCRQRISELNAELWCKLSVTLTFGLQQQLHVCLFVCFIIPTLKKKKKAMGILWTPPFIKLLNHWAEFNQTCYMTSPHGNGVLFFCLSRVRSSVCHAVSSKHKLATGLPLIVRVCGSNIIFPSVCLASVCHTISSQTNGWNLTKLAAWLLFMVRACESKAIHLSVHHSISNISTECNSVWNLRFGGELKLTFRVPPHEIHAPYMTWIFTQSHYTDQSDPRLSISSATYLMLSAKWLNS